MITGAKQKTIQRTVAVFIFICLLIFATACGSGGVFLLSGNEGTQYTYTKAQPVEMQEITAQKAGALDFTAADSSAEASTVITPDSGEERYADEGGIAVERAAKKDGLYQQNMIAAQGYFKLNLNGTNGEHTTAAVIKLTVMPQKDGTYKDQISQDVSAKVEISGANHHDLQLIDQNTGKVGKETKTTTVQALTSDIEAADQQPLVSKTDNGKTIYKTKSRCVINLQFQYTHPAYTYAAAGSRENLNETGGRANYKTYAWDDSGRSTLSDIVLGTDRTETFWVQMNLGNCGIIGDANGHASKVTMNVNLNHPQLTVKYNGNGGTIANSATTKVTYNSPAKRPKSYASLSVRREGYAENKGAEWNTRADGTGRSFTAGTAYLASAYKSFDFARGVSYAAMRNSLSLVLYAQWTPSAAAAKNFQIRLHVNKPAGSLLSMYVGGTFAVSQDVSFYRTAVYEDGGAAYANITAEYLYLYKEVARYNQNGGLKSAGLQQAVNFTVAGHLPVKPEGAVKYGWYTEPAGGDYISMDSTVTVDALSKYAYYKGQKAVIDLYAHWQGSGTIFVNNNGGSYALYTGGGETASWGKAYRTGDQVVFSYAGSGWYNTDSLIQSYPYREGYAFLGWNATDASGSELDDGCIRIGGSGTYGNGAQIPAYVFDSTGCTGDIWITAQWKNITHTLTVDNNGGTATVIGANMQPGKKEKWSKTYQEGSDAWFCYTTDTYHTVIPVQSCPSRAGYTFLGWAVSDTHTGALLRPAKAPVPDAYLKMDESGGFSKYTFTGAYDGDVTATAHWGKNCTIILDPNGGTLPDGTKEAKTLTPQAVVGKNRWCDVAGEIPVRGTSAFLGWYTEPGYDAGVQVYDAYGKCTNEGTYWKDNLWQYEGGESVTFYAHYQGFRLNVLAGDDHITSVSAGAGGESQTHASNVSLFVQPGETVTVGAAVAELYDFYGWTGNAPDGVDAPERKNDFYSFTMPDYDVTLTAHSTDGTYKIIFDPNGGEGHIDDIYPALLTGPVTLPAVGADGPYTHRNENGPSTFIGWDTDAGHYPADCAYANGATVEPLTTEHYLGEENEPQGVVVLYAVWDYCPGIEAGDLFYTLKEAQSGVITQEELMRHAAASDREDGNIAPGGSLEHENDFTIPGYLPEQFTSMDQSAKVDINYWVVDTAGNTFQTTVTVRVVDTTGVQVTPEQTTRFIDENYYYKDYGHGGLREDSLWKTNVAYRDALLTAFENLNGQTPQMSYYFSHEDIMEMKRFVEEHGVADTKEARASMEFYNRFLRY